MGKISVKEHKTAYHLKREELELSRDKASELLETISPERLERIENEKLDPYPEEILQMAEKYKAPELCNYYCSHNCMIGRKYVPEVHIKDLSQIVLQMLSSLNTVNKTKDRLVEIAADGVISDDEIEDFLKIQEDLERISITVEGLQLWAEQMVAEGHINMEQYNKIKNGK